MKSFLKLLLLVLGAAVVCWFVWMVIIVLIQLQYMT